MLKYLYIYVYIIFFKKKLSFFGPTVVTVKSMPFFSTEAYLIFQILGLIRSSSERNTNGAMCRCEAVGSFCISVQWFLNHVKQIYGGLWWFSFAEPEVGF